ncbi:MAG: hypothetical protein IPK17_00350 [Chloroflexi bacterium]|uniref:hypothetical protein n=1 Tax=Candidatus Flexifilum breve TaxID=3140694 RepID=UPI0031351651|nr:hypothetical protein [Chloroflexota bacterium]
MAEGDYTLPEPTQAELDQVYAQLVLLNADGQGVTINRFRPFYPKLGRGHLLLRLQRLQEAGRASSQLRTAGGPVPFEFWYPVEV